MASGGEDQAGSSTVTATPRSAAHDLAATVAPAHDLAATVAPTHDLAATVAPAHDLAATVPPPHDLAATVAPRDAAHDFSRADTPPAPAVHGPRSTLPFASPRELAETRASLPRSDPALRDGPEIPARLGRYVVLSQLGAGGMGVVYKAYDPELDRKVALKLLLGPASGQAAARLKREAQAMARLSHAHVVPIFDVGVVGERLFVAMDLVDGSTLSAWMETRHPWREVIDLFLQAGRGLAAAHAVGLVHRDFKPDNVLLGREPGGALVAKVADFGLARTDDEAHKPEPRGPDSELIALTRNSMLDHGMTRVGAVVGTPLYMSPEQHVAAPVDPRTDQFSFCVALFEALYGLRPFTGDTLEDLADAASRPQRTAPPPGNKVPRWLHRLCLRGLQPDREARFPSMDALLAEIDRRRGRGRVGLLVAGSLVAAAALTVALATRGPAIDHCGGGPARMQGVWDEPVQAASERAFTASGAVYAADAWTAARAQIDRYRDEWLTMHRDSCLATARGEQSPERLDLRMQCLDRRRQDLAALTSLYTSADKQVVRRAFDAALALPAIDGCIDPPAPGLGVTPPPADQLAAIDEARGALAAVRSLRSAGKSKDALVRAREVIDRVTPLAYPPLQAEAQLALAQALVASGDDEAAIVNLADAVGAALRVGDDARVLDGLLLLLEVSGWKLGRDKEAASWAALARGALARGGDQPRDEARLLITEASVDIAAARNGEAATRLERALTLLTAVHGPDSPRLGSALNTLGGAYLRSGRYAEAEALLVRATAMAEAAGGPNHPDVVTPLNNLALSHERQGRYADAIAALRRARTILADNSGPDHPNVGIVQQNIAGMLRLRGDLVAARSEADGALAIVEAKLGPEHPALATVLAVRGEVLFDLGELTAARADFQRADAMRSKLLGAEHPTRALSLLGLGRVELAEDQPAAALAPLELGLKLLVGGDSDPVDLAQLRFELARALWATGDRPRATALLAESRAGLVAAGVTGERTLKTVDAWLAAHPT
ncbi:tetratricopeptide repeat protein [Nannocystis sp.]|uniref:serine/threonine-protein kinase n=1 Tax=Nannocystis sp. TaxID=1962667 RepID=UPI0025CE2E3B|nr:tetratricopeptide repeat protein [Nannocystis sp.]